MIAVCFDAIYGGCCRGRDQQQADSRNVSDNQRDNSVYPDWWPPSALGNLAAMHERIEMRRIIEQYGDYS